MPSRLFAALAVLCLSACANARDPDRVLPNLAHLKSQATETFDLDLGPFRLGLAAWFLGKADDPDAAAVREAIKACKSVHIRHYEFASDFEYPQADIDAVRAQLSGRGWSSLVTVRNRRSRENVDVYIRLEGEKVTGFVVLASEAREFTIVNVVGSLDVAEIEKLRTHFSAQAHSKAVRDETSPDS